MKLRRTIVVVTAVGLSGVGAIVSPAQAVPHYSIVKGGAAYASANTRVTPNDGSIIDDRTFTLTTTSSAPFRLPFPIKVWGTNYTSLVVSTNGNVQFGNPAIGSADYSNQCLPTSEVGPRLVAVYYDDLKYTSALEGIFTKTITEGGVQKFVISWRGQDYGNSTPVRAEVLFTKNSNNFEFRYADGYGGGATIGTQKTTTGPKAQYKCNTGNRVVDAGVSLKFNYAA